MFPELPETTRILAEYPYAPLDAPAENIAERLIALGHLTFNRDVWAASPDRIKRYWVAYAENITGSANTNRVSVWWARMTEGMASENLTKPDYLHEKNLLLDPMHLSTPVPDQDVLQVFRQQTDYLIDRARIWVRVRNANKENQ